MDPAARDAIANAIQEVLSNPESKTRKFISKQYPPGPVLISGAALESMLRTNLANNMSLLK